MNEKLFNLINKQVTNEHGAALIYTQLAYELDELSLPGMRDWMFAQAAEEREHAQKFADHLLDRDEKPQIGEISVDELKIEKPLDAFKAALEHEKKVSGQIRDIARLADEVDDLDSRTLLNWFLDEQIEEEASVSEIIDQLELVGDNGSGILRIDAQLSER
ncbi:ferritin [Corynebacterium sp.]|uniref:ferritin n=1 Tax=Corynebacterium sp. TaxID=1720 RepID=UPI0027BAEC26|nr:ferritin [Corynebacterium sp.]